MPRKPRAERKFHWNCPTWKPAPKSSSRTYASAGVTADDYR